MHFHGLQTWEIGYLSGRIPADHLYLAKSAPAYGKMHICVKLLYISMGYAGFLRSGDGSVNLPKGTIKGIY
jgi:hypothetical protein